MQSKNGEKGFTYIEVIIAIIIMTVGILACLSAITFAMFRERQAENRNTARQITSSAIESIFAARDLRNNNVLNNWRAINNDTAAVPGIFKTGWTPIREDAGFDGIHGTSDDACATGTNCPSGAGTNNSAEVIGFQRRIVISDIPEPGIATIRKRKIEISVRYFAGQIIQQETVSTIIADLPFVR
jgi:Tfp pilus assembly protein PilV